jgi:hypothetical protein
VRQFLGRSDFFNGKSSSKQANLEDVLGPCFDEEKTEIVAIVGLSSLFFGDTTSRLARF